MTGVAPIVVREFVSTTVGRFAYARYTYTSDALHTENTFGVLTPADADAIRGTLYFLHGGDGTDEQWLQAGLEGCISDSVMTALVRSGIQIVLPSIGLSFLRAPDDAAPPSHWRALCDELMPHVEAQTSTTAASRWMTGISMGGWAALSALLRRPDMFAGCGVHFPGIVDFDPFDDGALHAYAARTGISDTHRDVLAGCFRGAFIDVAEYTRHDPLALVSIVDAAALRGTRIYMDVGSADEFGLHAGVTRFAEVCDARGIACYSNVIAEGRHDAVLLHATHDAMLRALIIPPMFAAEL